MVVIIDETKRVRENAQQMERYAEITRRVVGEEADIFPCEFTILVRGKLRDSDYLLQITPSIREIKVCVRDFTDLAVRIAEAYENAGEREYRVVKRFS